MAIDDSSKYDDVAQSVLSGQQADGVFMMVFGGVRGPGMSLVASPEAYAAIRAHLPDFLRRIADAIEKENRAPEAVSGNVN